MAFFLFFSCSSDKKSEQVTVADIHNPQSAEGLSKKEIEKMPILAFETLNYDFGKVIQGEQLSYVFKFTNTGKSNLIIYSTEASCGCTTTTPPKAPVKPGEKGEIKVMFNSKTQKGEVSKTVVVSANTYPTRTFLKIKANVVIP
ncbi:MAG: DUF1573 domain-containing protein [Bacteroidales bacterium]